MENSGIWRKKVGSGSLGLIWRSLDFMLKTNEGLSEYFVYNKTFSILFHNFCSLKHFIAFLPVKATYSLTKQTL